MALTWRNVDTPDFRSSMDGFNTFSRLLDNAFSGLQQGIGRADASIDRRVNNEFATNLLKFQDPAAYKAALTSGSLFANVDRNRLSGASIQAAGSRVGDLLNQATAEGNLAEIQYQRDRQHGFNAAEDAAAPLVGKYLAAATDPAQAAAFASANPNFGKGLSFAASAGLSKDAQSFERGAVDIAGGRLSNIGTGFANEGAKLRNQEGAWNFANAKIDRATADEADAVLANLSRNTFDNQSAITALNAMGNINPKVYNAVMARLGGGGNGAGAAISAAVSGSSGGGSGALSMTYGGGALPDNIQTVGDLVANKGNLVRSLGASPVGVYQINADTWADFAPKVLGGNWKNAPVRDFATQDAIARKIFESTGGDARKLMGRWASLDARTASQIAGLPWEQARQVIAAGESKGDPRALALGSAAIEQGIRNANMERNANNPANTYAKSAGDQRSVGEVAGALASDPVFKGMDVGYINENIRNLQSYARKQGKTINAAVAADILKNSISSSWASRNLPSIVGGGDRNGVYIDAAASRRYVDEYSQGNVDRSILANANTAQATGVQAAAQSKYDQAMARYQAAIAAQDRGVNVDTRPLEAAVNRAAAMLSSTMSNIGNNRAIARFNGNPAKAEPQRTAGRNPVRVSNRQQLWMDALKK